jgi:predicted TIM-barrel fold metal-dependent hydrolase
MNQLTHPLSPIVTRTRHRSARVTLAMLLFASLICFLPLAVSVSTAAAQSGIPFTDAHTHLLRHPSEAGGGGYGGGRRRASAGLSPSADVSAALALMDRFGVSYAILAPPPLPAGRQGAAGSPELQAVARQYPTRFAFSAGGESLNPLIQSTPPGNVTADVLGRFQQEARAIAEAGAAAFGELAAEHFSSRIGNHPYETVPPDHPLFLALADIAAQYNMPIELHMEAVPRDMPFPDAKVAGPPNPASIVANIAAFERLLDHNPRARIVWVHAGWDLTGERAVPLMLALLEKHPNLFMSVKSDMAGTPATAPFLPGGGLKPGWLAMLEAFPDRFVVGSDQFYDDPQMIRTYRARAFVDALPTEIARRIAYENVKYIYRLPAALR